MQDRGFGADPSLLSLVSGKEKKEEAIQREIEKAMVICGGFSGRDKTEKEETPAMQRRGKAKALWCAHGDASVGRTWNPGQRIHAYTYM